MTQRAFPRHVISREEYEAIREILLHEIDDAFGLAETSKVVPAPSRYPLNTAGAATEMRSRGLRVYKSHLDAAIAKGIVTPPKKGETRYRQWMPEDIDVAMLALLDDDCSLTPSSYAALIDGYSYAQHEAARRKAQFDYPEANGSLVKEVHPLTLGGHVPAHVIFRPMTEKERDAWRERIRQAREAMSPEDRRRYGAKD